LPEVAPEARAAAPFALRLAPRATCPMDGSERQTKRFPFASRLLRIPINLGGCDAYTYKDVLR